MKNRNSPWIAVPIAAATFSFLIVCASGRVSAGAPEEAKEIWWVGIAFAAVFSVFVGVIAAKSRRR